SGKVLIDPNVGPDETDSDAIDQGNGVSIIYDIGVVAGQDTPNNDAGVEEPPPPQVGSLSGRYFVDRNNNNQDDGEPGVASVSVALLDASGNPTGRTTTTDYYGNYSFGDLAPGTYGVQFTDTVSGKVLIDPNVGPDETDSD
ncbi:SdrD B-like domain-containing protein, partial [Thiorhodococcus minor]